MDISTQSVNETASIDLEDATGAPLYATDANGNYIIKNPDAPEDQQERLICSVTVYGPGSKTFQRAQANRNRSVMEAVRRGAKKMKDEEQRAIDAAFLAECTASFNGFSYKGMAGFEGFKAAYMDIAIGFVAEQVNKGIGDWSNFSRKPAQP